MGANTLARSCPKLEYINIGYSSISNLGIRKIVESCSFLRELNLHCVGLTVTDDCFRDVSSLCPHLHSLDLLWCRDITNEVIRSLIGLRLKILMLSGTKVNSDGLILISANFP